MNIASRIQQLRKLKGLSQEELADAIGVSRQAVSKWESEQSLPDIEKILLLCSYFNVTTDYLLKGQANSTTDTTTAPKCDAKFFTLAATVINSIGFLVALILYFSWQTSTAVLIGAIIMVIGCSIFVFGQSVGENKALAKRQFWCINVWVLSIIPIACISNFSQGIIGGFSSALVPFPQLNNSIVLYILTWLVYLGICLVVDLRIAKKKEI